MDVGWRIQKNLDWKFLPLILPPLSLLFYITLSSISRTFSTFARLNSLFNNNTPVPPHRYGSFFPPVSAKTEELNRSSTFPAVFANQSEIETELNRSSNDEPLFSTDWWTQLPPKANFQHKFYKGWSWTDWANNTLQRCDAHAELESGWQKIFDEVAGNKLAAARQRVEDLRMEQCVKDFAEMMKKTAYWEAPPVSNLSIGFIRFCLTSKKIQYSVGNYV
ncbi:hypothetical protein RND71_027330 [Anisodus tanguticus]|uniref:DUF7796 domain-containing protein n=1 Tax=Anisodus tanguticus TaxID=243964 RepID=A0AAE1RJG5_9SOLA|nr:hypothetical protein RND71_027330 [Anisodus tanguticus]